MRCISCSNEISSVINQRFVVIYSGCKQNVHYQCYFREPSKQLKQSWKCMPCTNVTKRNRNIDTPVRKNVSKLNNHAVEPPDQSQASDTAELDLSRTTGIN